ncbi:thiamine pyrophosphate-dependent enzyme [Betaproteobacteria bacterium]|nr:thiamine pyrophosphate-dependent enzyme [Betaproteobacteria bacterium]
MSFNEEIRKRIFKKACLARAFEEEVYRRVSEKQIKIPVYLSAGQEFISATIAVFLEEFQVDEKQIFIQHRGHATYLSFGGSLTELIFELLGDSRGCSNGMGGSASIQCREKNIYGHDGLMGSHGPISVGMCYGNKKFTLCFAGDAAAEEDYFLAAIGWASTKKLPIWFIIEDNNLSILTEKKIRRSWEMHDIASAFKMEAFSVSDDPYELWAKLLESSIKKPLLLNVNTNRLFWHAGAGVDSPDIPDIHKNWLTNDNRSIFEQEKRRVSDAWSKCLRLLEKK